MKAAFYRFARLSRTRMLGFVLAAAAALGVGSAAWGHDEHERPERATETRAERESGRDRGSRDADRVREKPGSGKEADADRATVSEKGASGSNTSGSNTSGSDISGSNSGSSNVGESSSGPGGGDDSDNSGSDSSNSGPGSSGSSGSDDRSGSRDGSAPRIEIDRDAQGRERRGGEVLMIGREEAIAAVRTAGYAIITSQRLAAFDETLARIRVSPGESIDQVVLKLQAIAPEAQVAPNHLFRPSQEAAANVAAASAASPTPSATSAQLGVIDTGAEFASGPLSRAVMSTQAFATGGYVARSHGTLVAEIAASCGATLAVADVFGVDADNRLIASAEAIARAIDWLVTNRVPVINISIEGPDNVVLAHVIQRTVASGSGIVAAAGNGGPAAPPAYPAAYPGVIAVTAVDDQHEVYRRANRGDYISFAARGAHIVSPYAAPGDGGGVSGTSYASPVVAAEIVRRMTASRTNAVANVLAALRRDAIDLGAPGRDPIYGWGQVSLPKVVTAEAR